MTDKPDLPTNCREHANGRVVSGERHYRDNEITCEFAKFLCGCDATLTRITDAGERRWSLDETIFWKEGQA